MSVITAWILIGLTITLAVLGIVVILIKGPPSRRRR
jgi:hypothetical protein